MSESAVASTPLSRRTLLRVAGGVAAGTAAGAFASGAARATPSSPAGGLSRDELTAACQRMADGGPRLTGNDAHRRFIDWIAGEVEATGLRVHTDRLTFDRWDPLDWSLRIEGVPTPLAFYFPYSGVTGSAGVTGALVHLGVLGTLGAWELARGKIAVVEVPTPPVPITLGYRETGRYPTSAPSPSPLAYLPSITDTGAAPDLEAAARAGVLGVVCIRTGVSDALAADQYAPFTTGYQGCPAVWAGPGLADRISAAARRGAAATLVMHARRTRGAVTETVHAVLPGTHPTETVVINTHTDGPNVAEENGALGLLSLIRQQARVPVARRRRTLVFVFVTGHFQLPQFETEVGTGIGTMQASSRWMVMHRDLWDGARGHRRAVAALTMEHLGCREWSDDAAHRRYAPTGLNEVGWCYTTTPAMRSIYLTASVGTTNTRTVTCEPLPAFYFGEGAPFYKSGIATMSLIPSQSYLTAAPPDGDLPKLDVDLMAGQIETFSAALRRIDTTSTATIGRPALPI